MLRSMIAFSLAATSPAAAQKAAPQAAIEAEMAASAAGWNAGDLDRFMAVYAGDAIYVAGSEIARGKPAIAARFAKSFVGGGNVRGKLAFQPVAWRTLSAVHMLLVALDADAGGCGEGAERADHAAVRAAGGGVADHLGSQFVIAA